MQARAVRLSRRIDVQRHSTSMHLSHLSSRPLKRPSTQLHERTPQALDVGPLHQGPRSIATGPAFARRLSRSPFTPAAVSALAVHGSELKPHCLADIFAPRCRGSSSWHTHPPPPLDSLMAPSTSERRSHSGRPRGCVRLMSCARPCM